MQLSSETVSVYKDFMKPYVVQTPQGQSVILDVAGKDSYSDKKKDAKRNVAIISLASVGLLVGLGIVGKTKMSSPLQKLGANLGSFFERKFNEANNEVVKGFFEKVSKGFNFIGDLIKNTVPNANNMRDSFLRKYQHNELPGYKILEKFDNATSGFYKSLGKKSLENLYAKAQKLFDKGDDLILKELDKLAPNASDTAVIEKIGRAKELIAKRQEALRDLSSGVGGKFDKLADDWTHLDKDAWDTMMRELSPKKGGKRTNFFKKFICEDMVAPEKAARQRDLFNVRSMITNDVDGAPGYTEQLGDILKDILSKEVYDGKIRSVSHNAKKAILKATNVQGNDMVDKLRDIQVGAAPGDFLSLMGSTGIMGIYLAQAETKEERVSGTLTKGIPLIATLATSMYGAAKMLAGPKAMLLAGGVGFTANAIGTVVDKIYRKNNNVDESKYTLPDFQDVKEELPEAIKPSI